MTSTIKVNNIQNQCGQNIINENSNTITIGASGDTIALASGASQSGFGRSGSVDWQTTVKTGDFTATSGEGYFVNTTSGAITVTLPASPSAGAIVAVADYAGTAATNNITIARNGSNIEGGTSNSIILINRQAKTFVYADATQGWIPVSSNDETAVPSEFICASGGTETTSGNYKIHTFTGPGTFTVCSAGSVAANNIVSYMVVAGGASGGGNYGGGGGAGGFREYKGPTDSYTASPLNGNPGGTAVTVSGQSYPITVGAGGAQVSGDVTGNNGSTSVFSSITSAGGGGGAGQGSPANNGGSGGGGTYTGACGTAPHAGGGTGNTPPTTPAQGTNGGTGHPQASPYASAGGGGATDAGNPYNTSPNGGGGDGATTSISASPVTRAGGGGSGANSYGGTSGPGGAGGGGAGGTGPGNFTNGTANTGGGGGGGYNSGPKEGGAGGSGIVIIRYKYQ
jgi:hypothetical protein